MAKFVRKTLMSPQQCSFQLVDISKYSYFSSFLTQLIILTRNSQHPRKLKTAWLANKLITKNKMLIKSTTKPLAIQCVQISPIVCNFFPLSQRCSKKLSIKSRRQMRQPVIWTRANDRVSTSQKVIMIERMNTIIIVCRVLTICQASKQELLWIVRPFLWPSYFISLRNLLKDPSSLSASLLWSYRFSRGTRLAVLSLNFLVKLFTSLVTLFFVIICFRLRNLRLWTPLFPSNAFSKFRTCPCWLILLGAEAREELACMANYCNDSSLRQFTAIFYYVYIR